MFECFRGKLVAIEPAYVVVDCQGVGYLLYMANPYRLADQINQDLMIYAYHHVSQDQQVLYGFISRDEKELFLRLIKVSGIGPKSALAILAQDNHAGFIQAVENENNAYLTQFPGIGKKTAGQLILDLKGKLADLLPDHEGGDPVLSETEGNPALDDAIQALLALGYSKKECSKVKNQLKEREHMATDAYLRLALSLLTSN